MSGNGSERLYVNNQGRIVVNGTGEPIGASGVFQVNGAIYATAAYFGNGTNNYIGAYSGNMLVYSQSGTTIYLGGGIGNRQNDVQVGNGWLSVINNNTAGAFGVNQFIPLASHNYGANPDATIQGYDNNNGGVVTLYNNDTTISAAQKLGILQWVGRDDQTQGYTMGQIICSAQQSPSSGSNGGGNLDFLTAATGVGAAPATRMRINYQGNVGINNTSPSARLDVTGDVEIEGNIVNSKTGIGVSNLFRTEVSTPKIIMGDENGYWTGSSIEYNVDQTDVYVNKTKFGWDVDPTELIHINKGSMRFESAGIKDNTNDPGAAGQALYSAGADSLLWQYVSFPIASSFYHSSFNASPHWLPIGYIVESTSINYYNAMVAPYNGRVRKVVMRWVSGTTPTATAVTFRTNVNGTTSPTSYPATVTGGGTTSMVVTRDFGISGFTFNEGDRFSLGFTTSGGTGLLYGFAFSIIVQYTENTP